jgi:hypothetical protein
VVLMYVTIFITFDPQQQGKQIFWCYSVSSVICAVLYGWTCFAPVIFPDRYSGVVPEL